MTDLSAAVAETTERLRRDNVPRLGNMDELLRHEGERGAQQISNRLYAMEGELIDVLPLHPLRWWRLWREWVGLERNLTALLVVVAEANVRIRERAA